MIRRRFLAGAAAVGGASAIWGTTFVLAKLVLEELPVAYLILYRFTLASAVLLPFLLASRVRPARRDVPLLLLTAFLMVPVTFLLQFGGLALTSATCTALMIGSGAPLMALAGLLFEHERLGARGWTAVAVSTAGVGLLIGMPGEGSDWRGNLLVLVSVAVATVWVVMTKRLVGRYPALLVTGWLVVLGTLFELPVTLVWAGLPTTPVSGGAWGALLALGIGCTAIPYVLWNWGVARIGAGPAGIFLNAEPAGGALLGILILGEPVTTGVLGGGVLILAAAFLVSSASGSEGEGEEVLPCSSMTADEAPAV
jgi:drug/metabolite transporter (DMT)-like permease